jgi:hypothetical protein
MLGIDSFWYNKSKIPQIGKHILGYICSAKCTLQSYCKPSSSPMLSAIHFIALSPFTPLLLYTCHCSIAQASRQCNSLEWSRPPEPRMGMSATQLGRNLKMDTNTSRNRNMTKAHENAQSKTISHMVSRPLTSCLKSGKDDQPPCTDCGTQQGPNWGFGSGELIGVVQTLFQILTLPPIAMHFMIHGRRHGP